MRHQRFFKAMMLTFGIALALPVALALTHDVASASGYMLADDITGGVSCIPGGPSDCITS